MTYWFNIHTKKSFNIYNNILNESFTFKTFFNKSTVFTNGLGFTLTNAENGNSSAYLTRKKEKVNLAKLQAMIRLFPKAMLFY